MTEQHHAGDWAAPPPVVGPPAPTAPLAVDLLQALRTVARGLLPVLVGLALFTAAVGGSAAIAGDGGSPGDWLLAAVVVFGLALGARLVVEGQVAPEVGAAGVDVGIRVLPLVVTAAVVVSLAAAARRSERAHRSAGPAQLLVRAGLAGLVAGVLVLLLALLTRTSTFLADELGGLVASPGQVSTGLGAVGAFFGPALLVGIVVAAARYAVVRTGSPRPAWWGEVRAVGRVLRTAVVGLVVVAAVLLVVVAVQDAAGHGFVEGGDGDVLAVGAALVLLGNVLGAGVLALLGVPLSATAYGAGAFTGSPDGIRASQTVQYGLVDEPVLLLLLLLPVLVVLVTAVRRTVRGRQLPLGPRSVLVGAGAGAVAGLLLALLVRAWASGGGGASGYGYGAVGIGQASLGPSLLWAPLLCGFWAALAVAAVRVGPTLVLSSPAWFVRLAGGRRQHPQWLAAVAGTGPPPAGRRSAAIRGTVLGVGVLAVLGVVGIGAVAVVRSTVLTPESALDDHLAALAEGDVAALGLEEPPGPADVLLSPEVLDSDAYAPPTDLEVLEVDTYGSSASAEIGYTVDGERATQRVWLSREDGLLGGWTVEGGDSSLYVQDSSGVAVQVAGVDVPEGSQRALPGTYTFTAADDEVLTADPLTVAVLGDLSYDTVSLEPRVRDEVTELVAQAVDEALTDCAARTTVPMDGCPFLDEYSYVPDDVTGLTVRVVTVPDWELELDHEGQLVIRSDYDGEVLVTGSRPPFSSSPDQTPRPYESDVSFSLDADVSVGDGEVELEFGY
ncbi:hypothetical protein SAMN03159343_0743 [Klenkia marina]|uniref:Uncharacterized protein n=1 Tax=Klenkia marina TaxID=1960309 RepID=A0A1G4XER8_9ACTN|nr:hypothetical protein [Klenkia marina]SCX39687.1 hypothetical protein SAMN03159343_0743 [Klenkia marina]